MDKFVKLKAIEEMAKPMSAFHDGDEPETKEETSEDMCECPHCGNMHSMPENESEEDEEY